MAKWFLAAALAAGMCSSPEDSGGDAAHGVLGRDAHGSAVALRVGDTLSVELQSIPTAGYIWTVRTQPSFLTLADEATRPTNPEVQNQPGFTGGNHFMRFDFEASAPGTGELVLIEGRPWEIEDGASPEDVWSVTVTVE